MNGQIAPAPTQALQLRDIHLPGDAPLWPPAPGWWLLAVVVVALLVWGGLLALRHYRIHRQRTRVMAVLENLEHGLGRDRTPEALAAISILLRRLALMRYPRAQVASLSGAAWLAFLDAHGGDGGFRQGPGRVLASGPYQRAVPADLDVAGLSTLVRAWIRKNTGR
jgi:Domain of unknown function (DUF4381)